MFHRIRFLLILLCFAALPSAYTRLCRAQTIPAAVIEPLSQFEGLLDSCGGGLPNDSISSL